jgi:integrase
MAGAKLIGTNYPGIYRRGDKYVVIYRDETGTQRKETRSTLNEARRLKRAREVARDHGELPSNSTVTLHAYAREWIARYQGGPRGFREETRREYRATLETYVVGYFDERLRLVDVGPLHVAQWIGWLCDPGKQGGRRLADKTVRNIVGVLRACLSTARQEGMIRHNPAEGAQLPHRPTIEDDEHDDARAMSREQLATLLALVHPRHRLLFRTLAATGLRISEAIALEWRHVDLDGDRPHVKVRQRIRGGKVGAPKSRHSRRDVPLPRGLVDDLRAQRATTRWPGPNAPVFPSTTGTPQNKDGLRWRVLRPAAGEADLSWAGLHTFRHTFASLHIDRGTNVVQLSKLLGHHSPAFTLDTYAHLLDGNVGEALDLDAELPGGNTGATFGPVSPGSAGLEELPNVAR